MKNYSSIVLGVLLCGGLIGAGVAIGHGISTISSSQRTVSVRGLCEKEVTADKVTWPVVTKFMSNDMQEIYTRVEQINSVILGFLHNNGISDNEIYVDPPQVYDNSADTYSSRQSPYKYTITNVVVVTSTQVDKVRQLIDRQTEIMKQGVVLTASNYNYPTTYEYTSLNKIKPDMIAEATVNAREAAEKFADDSHSRLGKIKSAHQGQFSIEDRDQYTPYIKTVRVVSSITYYLDD